MRCASRRGLDAGAKHGEVVGALRGGVPGAGTITTRCAR
jgi:hypothetical protein